MKNQDNTILDCGHKPSPHSSITNGYATDGQGRKHCYECCAKLDREHMQRSGRTTLYLSATSPGHGGYGDATITNWPGSLSFAGRYHKGGHNIAGTRYDVWFTDGNGSRWYGVNYGENSQLLYCRKLKVRQRPIRASRD